VKFEELPEEIPIGRAKDLTGKTFNYLTALFRVSKENKKVAKRFGLVNVNVENILWLVLPTYKMGIPSPVDA
jgi:hypothetical protein